MSLVDRIASARAELSFQGEDEWLSAASRARFSAARRLIKDYARGRVLDVGCGHMPFRDQVRGLGCAYVGLDVQRRRKDVDLVGDVQDLRDVADASFDTALCFEVLEHVPDPAAGVREMMRVLRGGGALLVTVPHLSRLHEQPHDYYRFTGFGLQVMAERAGARVERLEPYGGLTSFLAHQLSTVISGLSVGVPVVGSAVRRLNRSVLNAVPPALDRIIDRRHLFPLGYALAATKPPS